MQLFPPCSPHYPERQQDDVAGYIALSDCSEIGNRYVLVRSGFPDVLVAVADCAQAEHVAYRNEQGLIADVDVMSGAAASGRNRPRCGGLTIGRDGWRDWSRRRMSIENQYRVTPPGGNKLSEEPSTNPRAG